MNIFLFGFAFLTIANHICAYIVVQVRQQGDDSTKIDALVNKTVPANTYNKIAQKLNYEARRARNPGNDFSIYGRPQGRAPKKTRDMVRGVDRIVKVLMNLASVGNIGPLIQAHETYSLRPEVVHFRNGQSSIKYDVSVNTVLKAVNDFLNAKPVKTYTNRLLQKSKNVLRSLQGALQTEDETGNQSNEQ